MHPPVQKLQALPKRIRQRGRDSSAHHQRTDAVQISRRIPLAVFTAGDGNQQVQLWVLFLKTAERHLSLHHQRCESGNRQSVDALASMLDTPKLFERDGSCGQTLLPPLQQVIFTATSTNLQLCLSSSPPECRNDVTGGCLLPSNRGYPSWRAKSPGFAALLCSAPTLTSAPPGTRSLPTEPRARLLCCYTPATSAFPAADIRSFYLFDSSCVGIALVGEAAFSRLQDDVRRPAGGIFGPKV